MIFSLYHKKGTIKNTLLPFVITVVLCVAVMPVHAGCKLPSLPKLPNASTAVLAQMVKANRDVKAYMTTAKLFLTCTKSNLRHDNVVAQMRKLGKKYNTVVKSYKKRVKT